MKAKAYEKKPAALFKKSKVPFISIYLTNGSIAFSEKLAQEIGLHDGSKVRFVEVEDPESNRVFYAVGLSNSERSMFRLKRNARNPLKTASKEFCKFLLKYYEVPEYSWEGTCRLFVDTNKTYVVKVEESDAPPEEWETMDVHRIYSYEQISKGFKGKKLNENEG